MREAGDGRTSSPDLFWELELQVSTESPTPGMANTFLCPLYIYSYYYIVELPFSLYNVEKMLVLAGNRNRYICPLWAGITELQLVTREKKTKGCLCSSALWYIALGLEQAEMHFRVNWGFVCLLQI